MMPYLFIHICSSKFHPSYWQKHEAVYVKSFTRDNCSVIPALALCDEPGTLCFSCWVYMKDSVFVLNVLDSLCIRCVCVCECFVGLGRGGGLWRHWQLYNSTAVLPKVLWWVCLPSLPFADYTGPQCSFLSPHTWHELTQFTFTYSTENPRKLFKHTKMFKSSKI